MGEIGRPHIRQQLLAQRTSGRFSMTRAGLSGPRFEGWGSTISARFEPTSALRPGHELEKPLARVVGEGMAAPGIAAHHGGAPVAGVIHDAITLCAPFGCAREYS